MNRIILLSLLTLIVFSCENEKKKNDSIIQSKTIKGKEISFPIENFTVQEKSYLSIYSEIYSQTEQRTHSLTATVSIRNTSKSDTIILNTADYYSSKGKLIRGYLRKPLFLIPMETIDIVVSQSDKEGGTGANFLFEWKTKKDVSEPLFEGVMISTYGQQGLSFTTTGIKL